VIGSLRLMASLLSVLGQVIEALTDDEILYLVRCGVGYDEDCESLFLFT